jgi:hypothetical protein
MVKLTRRNYLRSAVATLAGAYAKAALPAPASKQTEKNRFSVV